MPEPLEQLRSHLQAVGLPDATAARLLEELEDHLEDLVDEAAAAGVGEDQQLEDACSRLGLETDLAAIAVAAYPLSGATIQGDTLLMSESGPRWAVAIVGSATITLFLLFALQLVLLTH